AAQHAAGAVVEPEHGPPDRRRHEERLPAAPLGDGVGAVERALGLQPCHGSFEQVGHDHWLSRARTCVSASAAALTVLPINGLAPDSPSTLATPSATSQ